MARSLVFRAALAVTSCFVAFTATSCTTTECAPGGSSASLFCRPLPAIGSLDGGRGGAAIDESCRAVTGGAACSSDLRCTVSGRCTCGNGRVDPGEYCDPTLAGETNCNDDCSVECRADSDCVSGGQDVCLRTAVCVRNRCVPSASTIMGAACRRPNGEGGFCDATRSCVACVEGAPCTEAGNVCRVGTLKCGGSFDVAGRCELKSERENGAPCAAGLRCAGGECSACRPGDPCGTGSACSQGTTTCDGTLVVCVPTSVRPGAPCGPGGAVCDATGQCPVCEPGARCIVDNACNVGRVSCTDGLSRCDAHPLPNGASCGEGRTCVDGRCEGCVGGEVCGSAQPCQRGSTACAPGSTAPTCAAIGVMPDGTTCGAGIACRGGACTDCTADVPCDTGNPCIVGTIDCTPQGSVCVFARLTSGEIVARAGIQCGPVSSRGTCRADGNCSACVANQPCELSASDRAANPCAIGRTRCVSGVSTCAPAGTLPQGTGCGPGLVCSAGGQCTTCAQGRACVLPGSQGECLRGAISCSSGAAMCTAVGLKAEGEPCSSGVCDGAGACVCRGGARCFIPGTCEEGVLDCLTGARCVPTGTASPPGRICREAQGSCDLREVCDGTNLTCGDDRFQPPNTVCRGAAFECDAPEMCDGLGARCGDDFLKPLNSACSGGVCDASGTCQPTDRCAGVACPNPCAQCNPANGLCDIPRAGSCSDGDACTTSDGCSGLTCVSGTVCPGGGVCIGVAGATDRRCEASQCNPALIGTDCPIPSEPCRIGSISCPGGPTAPPVCSSARNATDGISCTVFGPTGAEQGACESGVCTRSSMQCGMPCTVAGQSACSTATYDCSGGSPVCRVSGSQPDGASCDDGVFCNGSERCIGGTCTSTANPCIDDGQFCNGPESCDEVLDSCPSPDPCAGPCDEGRDECVVTDLCEGVVCGTCRSCNPATGACTGDLLNGTSCSNGLFCDGDERCSFGSCAAISGNPCLDDGIYCNGSESCNEAADRCDQSGDPCGDDSQFCNGPESCNEPTRTCASPDPCPVGQCDESSDACTGLCAAVTCTGCTACNPADGSCTLAAPDGTGCDNGNYCDGTDTCSGGSCANSTGDPCGDDGAFCNGAESCNEAADRCDRTAAPCGDDGAFCNGAESCDEGADTCVSGGDPCTPSPCDEGGDVCTDLCASVTCGPCIACNPADGMCTVPAGDGTPCSNGTYCDGAETCSGGACGGSSGDPCVDDGQYCNGSESCNEGSDSCDHTGDPCTPSPCDEGTDVCTDLCASVTCGPCNSCNPADGMCTIPSGDGNACDDGSYCNGTETCSAGSCGSSSGDPCTDDGAFCNGAESCDEGADTCVSGGDPCTPSPCDEGADVCTDLCASVTCGPCIACNPADGMCTVPAGDGTACDDGSYCNGGETCSGGTCGGSSGDPCVDDGQYCNGAESCNEGSDSCDSSGNPCSDDGTFCNGSESCNEGSDSCDSAGDPCGDDGQFCNGSESCNEGADSCDSSGNPCNDDGQFCNGSESCNEGADSCDSAGDPCGDDGQFCNGSESCNEGADSCDTSGNPCNDDGQFCNGSESCNEGADSCDSSGDPCGDDGQFCNGSESCNEGTTSCESSGDPCGGLMCDESFDACF